jgi:hypothetical protein
MSEPDPEQPVGVGQAGRRIGSERDLKLVAEDQVFKRNVATRSERCKKAANEK